MMGDKEGSADRPKGTWRAAAKCMIKNTHRQAATGTPCTIFTSAGVAI